MHSCAPEDVRLVDENEARQGLNVFDMAVEGSVHYGDSVLVIGRIGELPLRIVFPAPRPPRWRAPVNCG